MQGGACQPSPVGKFPSQLREARRPGTGVLVHLRGSTHSRAGEPGAWTCLNLPPCCPGSTPLTSRWAPLPASPEIFPPWNRGPGRKQTRAEQWRSCLRPLSSLTPGDSAPDCMKPGAVEALTWAGFGFRGCLVSRPPDFRSDRLGAHFNKGLKQTRGRPRRSPPPPRRPPCSGPSSGCSQ